ncbi:MAG: hypothetical protein ACFE8N_01290 [Promethearchaeota archaeon]
MLEVLNEKTERNIMMIINISSVIGIFLPSLLFRVCLKKIDTLVFWDLFFTIGWVISVPVLLLFFLIQDDDQGYKKQYVPIPHQGTTISAHTFPLTSIIFIFLAYFLLWSDKLISYPFSSWINSKFGSSGFSMYSNFYIIFSISSILGIYIAKILLKGCSSKYKIPERMFKIKFRLIILATLIYLIALSFLPFGNLVIILIAYSFINFLGGFFILMYTKIFIDVAKKGKNENLRFWIMLLSGNLATLFFVPLGTLLSINHSVEVLILLVIFFTSSSVICVIMANFRVRSTIEN